MEEEGRERRGKDRKRQRMEIDWHGVKDHEIQIQLILDCCQKILQNRNHENWPSECAPQLIKKPQLPVRETVQLAR